MAKLGLERDIVDRAVYDRTVKRFKEASITLPTFAQLADPSRIPAATRKVLAGVKPDVPHPANLFRVHWYNDGKGGFQDVPAHLVLPESLTGVKAKIVVVLGNRFPMIRAHKVLAAYACLAPRVVTGQFDPTAHKAIWPSTGNYCRGGVAISRIMQSRGVAVLPAGMSEERFRWLAEWVLNPEDVIKTPGTESNVKEIYDECARLDRTPGNVIFNQFCEFGNHLVHVTCTGPALERVFESLRASDPSLKLRAFTSATGSAGTIGAGDYLREKHGAWTVAVEALECPTMLENGFGEHNIQGIGDKHMPLIHNVMNNDIALAVSDEATDGLGVLFNHDAGRKYLLERRRVPKATVDQLGELGLSSICNILAAVKVARYHRLGEQDVLITVATDDASMYGSERQKAMARFPDGFDAVTAAETFGRHMLAASTDNLIELTRVDRDRIFNLGYFTWVEQQGVSLKEFEARRQQSYWTGLRAMVPVWDRMIDEFNQRVAAP
ncbi:MAG: pyridoxal-5'-phosphate-dependent protein subunit beta [Deltaproteobacteria bacterium]|nr:pyridoxal-5'-phosphate-dependent protein subunit beta [Deltaproteobacteria bacterium]